MSPFKAYSRCLLGCFVVLSGALLSGCGHGTEPMYRNVDKNLEFVEIVNTENPDPKVKPYMLNQSMLIPSDQIPDLENQALLGSTSAARKLVRYYDGIKLDSKEGLYWLVILAENGDLIGQYNYGVTLKRSSDKKEQVRATYWLTMAQKRGLSLAEEQLKQPHESLR